jgi:hypothetical protein
VLACVNYDSVESGSLSGQYGMKVPPESQCSGLKSERLINRMDMVVFRCTKRVFERFKLPILREPPASTGVLGDWYVNLMNFRRARFVLCTSARTLLPIILDGRKDFSGQFGDALGILLRALGVDDKRIAQELGAVQDVAFARTASRQILGTMNDFAYHTEFYLARADWSSAPALRVSLELAEMPCKPIGYESPGRMTLDLFRASLAN